MTTSYESFVQTKRLTAPSAGFDIPLDALPSRLFDWQAQITRWALRRGKAALFEGTGLGKTSQQCAAAEQIHKHTGGDVLILAPLAVAQQTVREAAKFGITVTHARDASEIRAGVNVSNYERLHLHRPERFAGVVLDESSLIKHHDAKTRTRLMEAFARTPYKLACTATPAPNDYMELGNHAEFLGVMSRQEMLAMFFVHDGGSTQDWRLKGHAEADFWRWLASWAVMIRQPSDLGYPDGGFALPPLEMFTHTVESDFVLPGMLFPVEATALTERRQARQMSLPARVEQAAHLANSSDEPWIIWCDLNAESKALTAAIAGAVEITGSDHDEVKEQRMVDFSEGRTRVLVTKPSIAGHGLNWQHCRNVAFVGLSDSWEQFYQAVRRCWRYGQTQPVRCHIIASTAEGAVLANIRRKEEQADRMAAEMVTHMADITRAELGASVRETTAYAPAKPITLPTWLQGESA